MKGVPVPHRCGTTGVVFEITPGETCDECGALIRVDAFGEEPDFFANVSTRRTPMDWNTFRFEFDADGTFHMRGRNGAKEAICVVCHEPTRWALDMFSFTTGPDHALAHARCAWTREGIEKQARLAGDGEGDDG